MADLQEYAELIERYVTQTIDASCFEKKYLDLFKKDPEHRQYDDFLIIDRLFSAVDEFCADPALRTETSLDESQLREECETALTKLKELVK